MKSIIILIVVNFLFFVGTLFSIAISDLNQTEIDMGIIFGMGIIPMINTMIYFSMKGGR